MIADLELADAIERINRHLLMPSLIRCNTPIEGGRGGRLVRYCGRWNRHQGKCSPEVEPESERKNVMKVVNCVTLGEACEALLDGEPVFVIRCQDVLAVEMVETYLRRAKEVGATNTNRIDKVLAKMNDWRAENKGKVKVPD